MVTPTDPLYGQQWHFALMGDIETIWSEYSGQGVKVGVYDDGVDYNHADLDGNYDPSLHVLDDSGNPIDPFPTLPEDGHGTAVAGIIAGELNGEGGVGVAWGAQLTGVNIFSSSVFGFVNGATDPFLTVVDQAVNFDISSNSWGSLPSYFNSQSLAGGGFTDRLDESYRMLSASGREGLGTIIVQAAGNDDRDANGSGVNSSRFTITVAATDELGDAQWYTNYGSSILVAAPAAAVTTDVTGVNGYDDGDYTLSFGGTSAATPVVSGVIALMLEANANLGWRDVQNILANSATHTGSALGGASIGEEDGAWYINNADNWNGGGMHVHSNYGYGMVNAYNAVRMAEAWSAFNATAQTSANERMASSTTKNLNAAVPDDDPTGYTFSLSVGSNLVVEHVALRLNFQSTYVGDLRIVLTSPEGTDVVVALQDIDVGTAVNGEWIYGIDSLRGELSAGVWTVRVTDTLIGETSTLYSAALDVYGAALKINDVHHVTDEFLEMVALDAGRSTISDTNGGVDWLNLSAVAGDIFLRLDGSSPFSVDGVNWGDVGPGGTIENVFSGDGDDQIYGTDGANELRGGRGADTLHGGLGNDTLIDGAGVDTMNGDGNDDTFRLSADNANDTANGRAGTGDNLDFLNATSRVTVNFSGIGLGVASGGGIGTTTFTGIEGAIGGNFDDLMTGSAGAELLDGRNGNDILNGGGGNDTLIDGAGVDTMNGDGNDDTFRLSADNANDTANGGTGTGDSLDFLNATSGVTVTFTGIGLGTASGGGIGTTTFTGIEIIYGSRHGDALNGGIGSEILDGKGGSDTMIGGAGDDTYVVDSAGDQVFETTTTVSGIDAGGIDTVRSSVTFNLSAYTGVRFVENLELTGTANINGTGNTLSNRLTGNAGNNTLDGAGGADFMVGGAGNDTYFVDNSVDRVFETTTTSSLIDAGGIDTIRSSVSISLDAYAGVRFVENLELQPGSTSINATGNALANRLTGNSGDNTLDGGLGADFMIGGAGNDTYIVDNAVDRVFETTTTGSVIDAGGIDTVRSSVSINLDAYAGVRFIENLTLTGTAHINGTGNALQNLMTGNSGNNTLNGGLGSDFMIGGGGNDTYFVDDLADRVFETTTTGSAIDAGGLDTVLSSVAINLDAYAGVRFVENLTLTGTPNINSMGNALANVMIGNTGNNGLNGGLGNDTLTGGAGLDIFMFNTTLGASNIDVITDFSVVDDTIRLDDAIFIGLTPGGLLGNAFVANLTGEATTATEQIIYETDTGGMFYDADGVGGGVARVQFATLSSGLALTNADFFVI